MEIEALGLSFYLRAMGIGCDPLRGVYLYV